MDISLNLKDLLILVLLILTIMLVVYLIMLVSKGKDTLKKVDTILDDAGKISSIAAEKTEQIDGVIDTAADTVMGIVESVHQNSSLISKIASVGTGAMAVKSRGEKKRSRKEDASLKRAQSRKARRK